MEEIRLVGIVLCVIVLALNLELNSLAKKREKFWKDYLDPEKRGERCKSQIKP